jgi:hypothetical protein
MPVATTPTLQTVQEAWFENFIAAVRTHQLQLETNTAPNDLKKAYSVFMHGSDNDLAMLNRVTANKHFIQKIILEYMNRVRERMPQKLAFDLNGNEVLVWAEIKNDDEELEDFLLMAEAEVNAQYHKYGYDITSTIVEQRDNLNVPNHFTTITE